MATKTAQPKKGTRAYLQLKINKLEKTVQNAMRVNSYLASRRAVSAALGQQFDGDRDLYKVFGYPADPDYEVFLNIYERDGLGTRIVDTVSDETWRELPVLVEGENRKFDEFDDPGPLQTTFSELNDKFHLLSVFNEVDANCGISRFALILLGLPGELATEAKPNGKLMYISVHDEGDAEVDESTIIRDPTNQRFGLPERYNIVVDALTALKVPVHYSRVVHIKEGSDKRSYRRIYGNPRLKPMLNRMYDLEKVVGGGSEAFWLLIRKGLALTAKEGMDLPVSGTDEYDAMLDEIEEYEHGLSRIMKLVGVDIKDLGAEPVSSRDQFDVITDYLAGTSHIPKRIMLGSERGELASSQDQFNFDDFIRSRQTKFAEPFILRPFVQRLGELKILKVPPKYTVIWKSLFQLTDMEKANIASTTANALSTITGNSPENAMPVEIFTQRYLGYKPSEEEAAAMQEKKTEDDEANQTPPETEPDELDELLARFGGNGNGNRPDRARLNEIISRLNMKPLGKIGNVVYFENTKDIHILQNVTVLNQDDKYSAMIAFMIPDILKQELKSKYAWIPDDVLAELHITLCYLGDIRTLSRVKIDDAVKMFTTRAQPIKIKMQGIGRFVSGTDKDPIIVTFDSQSNQLVELRRDLTEILNMAGIPYHDDHGYIPHMTLAYIDADAEMPADTIETLEMNFGSAFLVIGGEQYEYEFGNAVVANSNSDGHVAKEVTMDGKKRTVTLRDAS